MDVDNVVSFVSANHTSGGLGVVRMNQTYKVGPGKSIAVFPGDEVDMEVWEYHESSSGYGTSGTPLNTLIAMVAGAIGGVSGGGGEAGLKYNGVSDALTIFGTGGNQGDGQPAAYLNYILFDKTYKVLDAGWQIAPATTFTKQKISFSTLSVKEAGYLYTWLSYDDDSNNWVYFDDFKVTHTKNNIIQYNEYYPFGLQTANSWTRENTTGNNFLGNGGTELNTTSSLYDLAFRNYDPVLGRMNGVDPMAAKYSSLTPYNFSFNDPVTFSDPSGATPETIYYNARVSPNYTSYTYDDRVDYHRPMGEFYSGSYSSLGSHFGGRSGSLINWGYESFSISSVTNLTIDINWGALPNGMHYFGFDNGYLTFEDSKTDGLFGFSNLLDYVRSEGWDAAESWYGPGGMMPMVDASELTASMITLLLQNELPSLQNASFAEMVSFFKNAYTAGGYKLAELLDFTGVQYDQSHGAKFFRKKFKSDGAYLEFVVDDHFATIGSVEPYYLFSNKRGWLVDETKVATKAQPGFGPNQGPYSIALYGTSKGSERIATLYIYDLAFFRSVKNYIRPNN